MINDVSLERTAPGTFDWSFSNGDIDNVTGIYQIASAAKHAVLLRPNELIQTIYIDKGNTAWNLLRIRSTENAKTLIESAIQLALEKLSNVATATVNVSSTETMGLKISVILMLNNGEEVSINEI